MAHQWKAGDLAVCVDNSSRWGEFAAYTPWRPTYRGTYKVAGVRVIEDDLGDFVALDLVEDPDAFNPEAAWEADRFRPILPADPAFTDAMRSLKPRVEA